MRTGPVQRRTPRRAAAVILATATLSMVLVAVTGTPSAAEPVNTNINVSCGARGGDPETLSALQLAGQLLGSSRLNLTLNITAANIPPAAGLDEEIDARFTWQARLDQNLINQAAPLVSAIDITNASGTMQVRGPSSESSFSASPPNISVRPTVNQPANVNLGTYGGPITTTGGGIITYRVGSLQFDAALNVTGVGPQNLKLQCNVQGSNLIARTTVRDPDAPIFEPEVLNVEAAPGETVQVDMFGDVIQEGATELLRDTLEIVEDPEGGSASLDEQGIFTFQAPTEPGTYSTTLQVCGAPKDDDEGIPGVNEVQEIFTGANWRQQALGPRPVAFSLKVGEDEETPLIWTVNGREKPFLLDEPTPENWAPENRAGVVGQYLLTEYRSPTANQIRRALEAVPSIGAGNVEVEEMDGGFRVTYVNERAEQNMPDLSLGQWYSILPQEVLDRIIDAAGGLIGGDGDEGGEPAPEGPYAGLNPTVQADLRTADGILQAQLLAGVPTAWEDYFDFRIFQALAANANELIALLTSIFPSQVRAETVEQGEEPTPPQPLCAQGIIDVTVAEVEGETEEPGGLGGAGGAGDGTEVGGIQQTNGGGAGIGFVG